MQFLLGLEGRVGYAVDADQLGGDALADLGVVVRLAEDGEAGVGMEVDETRTHYVPGGVNHPAGVAAEVGVVAAVDGDGVAGDGDGGAEAGAAGAVDYLSVGDKEVNHGGHDSGGGCGGQGQVFAWMLRILSMRDSWIPAFAGMTRK